MASPNPLARTTPLIHLPLIALATLFAVPLLVMIGRVYVGAHNPLDVTAGLGAGLLVGGGLALVLG